MKYKQKRTNNIIKKLIVFNACLALAALLVAGSFAAYTSLTSAKRVVSTIGSKQLFSSNILVEFDNESNIQGRTVSFSGESGEKTIRVTICNYAQGDKTKYSANTLEYSVDMVLLNHDGTQVTDQTVLSAYKWDGTSFSQLETVNGTVPTGSANEIIHEISVPAEYMKLYKIKIIASSTVEGYKSIGRIITLTEDAASAAWRLDFLPVEETQKAYDLGCINTNLSGSEHANFTLMWDTKHVDIDPWFLKDIGKEKPSPDGNGWCSLTFEVGGVDGGGTARPNRYNVIFYRTFAVQEDDKVQEKWDDIKSYVKYSSTKITE